MSELQFCITKHLCKFEWSSCSLRSKMAFWEIVTSKLQTRKGFAHRRGPWMSIWYLHTFIYNFESIKINLQLKEDKEWEAAKKVKKVFLLSGSQWTTFNHALEPKKNLEINCIVLDYYIIPKSKWGFLPCAANKLFEFV